MAAMRHIRRKSFACARPVAGFTRRAAADCTLGVFGYGKIGSSSPQQPYSAKVIVFGREGSLSRATSDGRDDDTRDSSRRLMLSLTCLTDETQGIVTREVSRG
jgi:phosphoglycerate dehydrogenase-like enzyme